MIHFVVHDDGDSVGVVVVEGVKPGDELTGWIMDQDREITFKAATDIPIGHKLAIKPLNEGDTVIKYGVDIGRVVADIGIGERVRARSRRSVYFASAACWLLASVALSAAARVLDASSCSASMP